MLVKFKSNARFIILFPSSILHFHLVSFSVRRIPKTNQKKKIRSKVKPKREPHVIKMKEKKLEIKFIEIDLKEIRELDFAGFGEI